MYYISKQIRGIAQPGRPSVLGLEVIFMMKNFSTISYEIKNIEFLYF